MATEGVIHRAGVRFVEAESQLHGNLIRWSIPVLRVSVGFVFLAFGILKFFPDVSPAQNLAETTFDKISFGLVPGGVAILGIATLECFIGLCLLLNRWMRLAVWLLVFQLIGILSPIFLLPDRLFGGPDHAPTLEGQYVIKDVILVAAAMVIAAGSFRGGRLIRTEPPAGLLPTPDPTSFSPERRLEIVLSATGTSAGATVAQACLAHGISQTEFYEWRDQALKGAGDALTDGAADQAES